MNQQSQRGSKLNKSKKCQGLPINMIIIAAIALVVLVVTVTILTRQTSTATKNLESCDVKGGKCAKDLTANNNVKNPSCSDNVYNIPVIVNDPACGDSKLCCLKI